MRVRLLFGIAGVAAVGLALALALVSGAQGGATSPRLRLTGGYVPQPASPDVAVAYVIVHNDGDAADALVSASTPDAAVTSLHREVVAGGAEEMVPVAGLTVPAHGSLTLSPGGAHVMLAQPHGLTVGRLVPVTLVFARSGSITVDLPVRGLLDGAAPADAVDTPIATPGGG